MIGDISERDKVLKFWNGSRAIIQKGLWRDNLNPEISTWEQVVAQAEIIEISENVAERRDRRVGPSHPSGSGEGASKSKNPFQTPRRSAQAVTFDAPKRRHGHDRQRSRARTTPGSREGSHHSSTTARPSVNSSQSSGQPRDSSTKSLVEGNLRHQPLVELSQLNPEFPDDPKRKLPSFERQVDASAVGEKGILVEIALKTTLCMQVALNPQENPLSTLSRLFWKGMKKSKFWIVYH